MSIAEIFLDGGIITLIGLAMSLGATRLVSRFLRLVEPSHTGSPASATLKGGAWIGILERISIYAAILTGFGAGIAIVLAIKGLGRYPDLRSDQAGVSERFIIGTFASCLVAAAAAGLAHWLIGLT